MIAEKTSAPQKENVDYDSSWHPLYIHECKLSDYSPTLSAIAHYHDDLEFMYLVEGHISYYVNGVTYDIGEHEGIFVNAKNLHYGYSADGTDCTFICILLNPTLISSTRYLHYHYVLPLIDNHSYPAQVLHNDVPWMKKLNSLLRETYDAYTAHHDGFELTLQCLFNEIWLLLYENMPAAGATDPNSPEMAAVRSIVTYIQEHRVENISLCEIAGAGNISSSYCCRLFKKYIRQSPMEYLRTCRLDYACELLADNTNSITDVAYRSGFSGTSYFIERFREKYGVTPAYYRKHVIRRQET